MTSYSKNRLFWVTLYAACMGWFEATLVIYLRLHFYPEGFAFPIKTIPGDILWIEQIREACTIVMLVAVGYLAGRNGLERFGYLMLAFGVWDIVYYVGLFAGEGWPTTLLEWDLLFLLPVPWIGPVLAPVLVSLSLITACVLIVLQEDRGRPLRPRALFWAGEILCGLIIILSFILDYPEAMSLGAPDRFRWEIFLLGWLPGLALLFWTWRKTDGKTA